MPAVRAISVDKSPAQPSKKTRKLIPLYTIVVSGILTAMSISLIEPQHQLQTFSSQVAMQKRPVPSVVAPFPLPLSVPFPSRSQVWAVWISVHWLFSVPVWHSEVRMRCKASWLRPDHASILVCRLGYSYGSAPEGLLSCVVGQRTAELSFGRVVVVPNLLRAVYCEAYAPRANKSDDGCVVRVVAFVLAAAAACRGGLGEVVLSAFACASRVFAAESACAVGDCT
jgi:hypothetical protein